MTVDGSKQGNFKGDDNETKIKLLSYLQEISAPRDASGMATGRTQAQPVTIVKQTGASSPQFLMALATNEMLKTVTIEFLAINANGEEYVDYVVTLRNVVLSSFKQKTEVSINEKSGSRFTNTSNMLQDEIRLSYQTIEVESKSGKTMAVYSANIR